MMSIGGSFFAAPCIIFAEEPGESNAMDRVSFRIRGMCCGEEIGVLRRVVGPLVGGESNLAFDLLTGRMTVLAPADTIDEEAVKTAVAELGMEAISSSDSCGAGSCPVEESWWSLNGRLYTCIASALFILFGFLLDAYHRGSLMEAFAPDVEKGYEVSLHVILIYLCAVISGGWFIFPRALFALQKVRPDMNLLMVIAALGAMSLGQWLEAASVTFLFALALLLESWSVGRARSAIKALLDLTPATARFLCPEDGDVEEKPIEEVPVGVSVLVRPGEKVPLDGVVTKGATSVNQAPITGESLPVSKEVGDDVYAGTINVEGSFEFRTTRPAADTTLAHIIRMVEEAQSRRAPIEQWVEKFARYYTPVMIMLSFLVALLPPVFWGGDWASCFYRALVILVIACPCSLVISTPVSIVAGLTSASRHGILIKGGAYLEAPGRLQSIAFDKTGTLTLGHPAVSTIVPLDDHTEDKLLSRAASLEAHSTHPVARAILSLARSRGLESTPADNFTILPGQGALGTIADKTYWVGSHRLLEQWDHESAEVHARATSLEDAGHSLVIMWCEDHVCGLMSVADRVRPEAELAIRSLNDLGIDRIVMLTGDNQRTAEQVASQVGISEWYAELLPEDKVDVVKEISESHGPVAMVGDGVNDAPAMASADVSIAMGAIGSDAAIETADIALMSDDLSRLPWLIRHSRRTLGIIKQNIMFSLVVKASFIGLAFVGIATLWEAIAADMGASLLVIFNGLRLLASKPPSFIH
jgi:Zn2+/Cd2+-exporting ATPase